jgi:hypothetical protein
MPFPCGSDLNMIIYYIIFSNQTGGGTVVVNTTLVPPTVQIRIVDHSTGNPNTKEAQLGQELEFRIDVNPENGKSTESLIKCGVYN